MDRIYREAFEVMQEAAPNLHVAYMCGDSRASVQVLEGCLMGYKMHGTLVTKRQRPVTLTGPVLASELYIHDNAASYLWLFLHESRECLSTDPRDKLFALRSLMPAYQERLDHIIDYTKSVVQVFMETAKFLLPVYSRFLPLSVTLMTGRCLPGFRTGHKHFH